MHIVRIGGACFPWVEVPANCQKLLKAGRVSNLKAIESAINSADWEQVSALLRSERGSFGVICETDENLVVICDRIRSFPLYVRETQAEIEVSPSVAGWVSSENAEHFDEAQARLFLAAGYTLGDQTLLGNVSKVVAGHFVVISKQNRKLQKIHYSLYKPEFPESDLQLSDWEERLDVALSSAIGRTIDAADGHTIWVPLSAGFDSRAVLASVLEQGYDNVQTFSYGSKGNTEAKVAQEIAEKAGVRWRFVDSVPENPRSTFRSKRVTDYFLQHGGLGYAPAMSEYFPMDRLSRSGHVKAGDIIVNGQSGDFLTGGHIPKARGYDAITKYVHAKHFSLFFGETSFSSEEEVEGILRDWSSEYLSSAEPEMRDELANIGLYLAFECQERQCQYVVQQQRAYDYFGLDWTLPLWDGELMDLFQSVPLSLHINQALYLGLLKKKNYRGLFDEGRRPVNPWPKYGSLIQLVARAAGVFGADKTQLYKKMYYWSDSNYLYTLFGRRVYNAMYQRMRGSVSLISLDYLNRVRSRMGIADQTEVERLYGALVVPLSET